MIATEPPRAAGHPPDRAAARTVPPRTRTPAPVFGIDELRTVSATAGDPFTAPTQTSFPDGTASIVVDATYHGAGPAASLDVNLSRMAAPGQPVTPVLSNRYILNPAGDGQGRIAIVIATPLSQGHYILNASYAGQGVLADAFDVTPPPAPPSPTPRPH